jgi:hypothetical protein
MDSQWKKAVGALKDVASIGLADLNGPMGFIDIAVVKATQHNDSPPKEKHVFTALAATNCSLTRPRLKRAVEERLRRTKDWMVAVKTLALIHRLIRDSHYLIFIEEEEMRHSSHATLLAFTSLQFHDRSSRLASDCSLWVRRYSSYLDHRLRCNRIFKCDILSESHHSRTTNLDIEYIFIALSSLQQLLGCLLNCAPQGSRVVMNSLIQYALDLLVKDGRNIYRTINHFICKLVDSFIAGMPKYKVVRLINIYKLFYQQCDRLSEFYDNCRMLSPRDNVGLPRVEKPSESLLAKMENYVIKCANHTSTKELTAKAEETPLTGAKEVSELVVPAVSTGEAIEERLLITWGDGDVDDNSNTLMDFGSANTVGSFKYIAQETHERNAYNDWEIALDCSIINPSASYQPETAMDRLSPTVSFDNILLTQKWSNGTDGDVIMSGYGIHPSVTDDMPSMLRLPSIEMEHNTQLQDQEVAMDGQRQKMASAHRYLLTNKFEDVSGLHQGALHNYKKNPFEEY